MQTIREPEKDVPVIGEYDVVVAGGGPGGLVAATAAARAGAKTLLIERYGYLGGMATAGLVAVLLGTRARGSEEPMIGGIAEELCRQLHALGGAPPYEEAAARGGVPFDPETFKYACDQLVTGSGAQLRLHSWVVGAVVEQSRLRALVLESKSGRQAVLGKVFVDATGDADVVARSGAGFTFGREADGAVQAMGSMFHIAGVDAQRLPTGEELKVHRELVARAVDAGELNVYHPGWGAVLAGQSELVLSSGQRISRAGHYMVNATRFAGDPTNVEDLTRGELAVRRDTWQLVDFWRRNLPGMEDVYLVQTPAHIGLRESRQMIGRQRVTGSDVVQARRREDAVARCPYWIDIHCPLGRVQHGTHLCYTGCPNTPPCPMYQEHYTDLPGDGSADRQALGPRDGLWFDIPWGSLVSADLPNLIAAGRCICADHQAMAALRVMGTCMAIGQAAGEGAAMAAAQDGDAWEVPVAELQERLRASGAPC